MKQKQYFSIKYYNFSLICLYAVSYTHLAIDRHLVSVSLTCANQTKTKLAYQVKDQGKQLRYQFSSIPFQRTFDGIYTVSVKAKDRAGNQSEKTLTFSVNRFGSVYELPKVSNAYYRHPFAIEITESNVTRLLCLLYTSAQTCILPVVQKEDIEEGKREEREGKVSL